jgi:hypothetical protein
MHKLMLACAALTGIWMLAESASAQTYVRPHLRTTALQVESERHHPRQLVN